MPKKRLRFDIRILHTVNILKCSVCLEDQECGSYRVIKCWVKVYNDSATRYVHKRDFYV